jgi:hypothetical protein
MMRGSADFGLTVNGEFHNVEPILKAADYGERGAVKHGRDR